MKEIGILEIKWHEDFLSNICRICKTENTNVTIFTTKKIFLNLRNTLRNISDFNFVIKSGNESDLYFLKRIEQICNKKIDVLFVNTIQGNCLDLAPFLFFEPKSKKILTIHNVNAWFKPKLSFRIRLDKLPLGLLKPINTNASSIIRHFILQKYDAINVIYPPMKRYILNNTEYKNEIYTLPYSFYEKSAISKNIQEEVIFTVPGVIREGRLDYGLVIKTFEALFRKYANLKLFLLGFPYDNYGRKIIHKCKYLANEDHQIYYFEEPVPRDVWSKIFAKSDIILLPFEKWWPSEPKEVWGTTKGSGSMLECIRYGKPFLVPESFEVTKELSKSYLKYNDNENFNEIIESLINNKEKIDYLKEQALINSKKKSVENLRDYFNKEFLKNTNNETNC